MERRTYPDQPRGRDPLFVVGIIVTVAVHLAVLGAIWIARTSSAAAPPLGPGTFVDAQLVKFGKPRDLSFLPHKQGQVKDTGPPVGLKVAKDAEAKPTEKKPDKQAPEIDPLKKTHANLFKNLRDDDRPPAVAEQGGSLSGSRAGTATEASGDPYIAQLKDQIGSAWTVPTTIKDSQLASLSADVCLTIDNSGNLTRFVFNRRSGNSQFDSSLEATLGVIKHLPPPPARFAAAAARGHFCAAFSKQ